MIRSVEALEQGCIHERSYCNWLSREKIGRYKYTLEEDIR